MELKKKIEAARKFVVEDIWRIRKDNTSGRQYWFIRVFRIFVLAFRRFVADDCSVKASALTYYSLLSVVPVVALIFAISKGFGFLEVLEEQLQTRLSGHEEVVLWIQEFALSYLENTKGGMIAGVGVVILLWSVMKILGNIELSFNDIWDVQHSRSMVRKFSDYISFVLVATILMMLSSSFLVFVSNSINIFNLGSIATPIITWASPYIIIWVLFTLMFMLMPNTKVKFASAVFGGVIAGSLFIGLQFAYLNFQIGMSKYNAIYGSFAALPLFLIWMQSSWLIVLLGAELSFSHQNEKSYEFETDTDKISDHYRRLVSLLVAKRVIDLFANEKPAPTASELSLDLKLPIRLVYNILRKLEEAKILVEVLSLDGDREVAFGPAFDTEKMTINCIIHRLETYGSSDFHFEETDDYKNLRNILEAFDLKQSSHPENGLIKNL